MKRWTEIVLVSCAAGVALAQWLAPVGMQGLLGALLFGLVVLTVFSRRTALNLTLESLNAAHNEQLEGERRYRALFDACSDAIAVHRMEEGTPSGQLVEVNEAACQALGYSRDQLLTKSAGDLIAPEYRRDLREHLLTLREANTVVFETVYLTSEGHRFPAEASLRLTQIRGQRLCLTIARDISLRKEREERWRSLSHEDELTGLLNRRGFFVAAEQAARRARRLGTRALLMYFDVDGLKDVNDRLGHPAGDVLLQATAEVLRKTFRGEDVLARLGGDEFVGLAMLGHTDELLDQQAIEVRLVEAIARKRNEMGSEFDFSVSHGALLATHDELARMDELIARSDELMYKEKSSRRRRLSEQGLRGLADVRGAQPPTTRTGTTAMER